MMITISLIVIYNKLMILNFLKNLKFLQGVGIENLPKMQILKVLKMN